MSARRLAPRISDIRPTHRIAEVRWDERTEANESWTRRLDTQVKSVFTLSHVDMLKHHYHGSGLGRVGFELHSLDQGRLACAHVPHQADLDVAMAHRHPCRCCCFCCSCCRTKDCIKRVGSLDLELPGRSSGNAGSVLVFSLRHGHGHVGGTAAGAAAHAREGAPDRCCEPGAFGCGRVHVGHLVIVGRLGREKGFR